MQRIIIADGSDEFRLTLTELLARRYEVHCCDDGNRALELLRLEKTAALVLDLSLSGVDGLEVLRRVHSEQLASAVIVTSVVFNDYVAELLARCGVDYAVRKPCQASALAERVEELCCRSDRAAEYSSDSKCAVQGILLALGLPSHRMGFRYCREGILMLAQEPDLQITKQLYPTLGKSSGSNGKAVERAMRIVITAAWENRDNDIWRIYFAAAPNGQVPKPTNAQFLSRIADRIAIGCRKTGCG